MFDFLEHRFLVLDVQKGLKGENVHVPRAGRLKAFGPAVLAFPFVIPRRQRHHRVAVQGMARKGLENGERVVAQRQGRAVFLHRHQFLFAVADVFQVPPQLLIGRHHHPPIEGFPGPPAAGLAHLAAQVFVRRQGGEGVRRRRDVDRGALADEPQIFVIFLVADLGDHFRFRRQRQIAARLCQRHPGRNGEAVDAGAHRVAVAVPIGNHRRQPRRHRLDGGQAEGFLDVVGKRGEDIGREPDPEADVGLAAIEENAVHGRTKCAQAFAEFLFDGVV